MNEHIVEFNKYCDRCKYKDYPESSLPCHECLDNPVNTDSRRPVKYTPTEEWIKKEELEKKELKAESREKLRRD